MNEVQVIQCLHTDRFCFGLFVTICWHAVWTEQIGISLLSLFILILEQVYRWCTSFLLVRFHCTYSLLVGGAPLLCSPWRGWQHLRREHQPMQCWNKQHKSSKCQSLLSPTLQSLIVELWFSPGAHYSPCFCTYPYLSKVHTAGFFPRSSIHRLFLSLQTKSQIRGRLAHKR